jgi:hypothetical protein
MPRKKIPAARDFPEVMNLVEFMKFLRVSCATAKEILKEIPHRHYNREWRIVKQDAVDWVRKESTKGANQ